jgi:diaminopimelate decarboxylase
MIADAVKGACRRQLLCNAKTLQDHSMGFFFDLDSFEANLGALRSTFPPHWHHAMAIKSNPLAALMRLGIASGHGVECASIGEVQHALRVGCKGSDVVFDSPCKNVPEIAFAIEHGVHINADNLDELVHIKGVLFEQQQKKSEGADGSTSAAAAPVVGLRINPLVGAGGVSSLSVSTRQSKFGVIVPSDKESLERLAVVSALVFDFPFVNAIHVHVGSGSMRLEQAAQGAAAAVQLALEVNRARQKQALLLLSTTTGDMSTTTAGSSEQQPGTCDSSSSSSSDAAAAAARSPVMVDVIDIGGGLPVGWGLDGKTPTWQEYQALLFKEAPELFDGTTFRRVVTEFGASLFCKYGWLGSAVEVVKNLSGGSSGGGSSSSSSGNANAATIAMIHAGSDLFLRACYAPQMRGQHPITAYSADGSPKAAAASTAVGKDHPSRSNSSGSSSDSSGNNNSGANSGTSSGITASTSTSASSTDSNSSSDSSSSSSSSSSGFHGVEHDIAGPLCFAGDVVAKGVLLPSVLEVGDVVVVHEAGGNTLALSNSHCSRRRPPVFGYRRIRQRRCGGDGTKADNGNGGSLKFSGGGGGCNDDEWGTDDGLHFSLLNKGSTTEQVLEAWSDE